MNNIEMVLSNSIARQLNFDKYCFLTENVKSVDLTEESDRADKFRNYFTTYFVLRRGKEWRDVFFGHFNNIKNTNITLDNAPEVFNEAVQYIYDTNKSKGIKWKVEPSFVSKMLAVICNDLPIYDSEVVRKLGFSEVNGDLNIAKANYKNLIDRYKNYLESEEAKQVTKLFDEFFPNYKSVFSDTKKIDYFLWSMNEDELAQFGLLEQLIN